MVNGFRNCICCNGEGCVPQPGRPWWRFWQTMPCPVCNEELLREEQNEKHLRESEWITSEIARTLVEMMTRGTNARLQVVYKPPTIDEVIAKLQAEYEPPTASAGPTCRNYARSMQIMNLSMMKASMQTRYGSVIDVCAAIRLEQEQAEQPI